MNKFRRAVALAAAFSGLAGTASATPDIQPGMALSPQDLPPEARDAQPPGGAHATDRLISDDPNADPMGWANDTVDERRHFDDRTLHLGIGTGLGTPVGLIGVLVEANVLDGLAVGAGAGVASWGPAGGAFMRLRPFVWGGQGERVLHAFTLQSSYTYMLHGKEPLTDVDIGFFQCEGSSSCEPEPDFVPHPGHFLSLSAGFEHALVSGWSFRYDFGFASALNESEWECAFGDTPTPCTRYAPDDTVLVGTFAFSHAL